MMRKFFLIAAVLFVGVGLYAQSDDDYEYADRSEEIEEIEVPPYVSKHYLGDEFTKMFFALKEQYVYLPEKTATNPEPSPTTEKPVIYNTVKKLDRYYKKMLKKGKMSKEEVIEKLETIVAVGYSIRYEETKNLEKMLWKMKDVSQLEALFTEKIILN